VYPGATREVICRTGYSATVRDVPQWVKDRVYAAYGIGARRRGQYEIDHLVPLEGGGSNSIANLFPEAAAPVPGFHQKDELENDVHDEACAHGGLRALQRAIASDWVQLDRRLG
jgi:hypothetical protein